MTQYYKISPTELVPHQNINSDLLNERIPANLWELAPTKTGYKLQQMDLFDIPDKLYGDNEQKLERIKFNFENRNSNLGILLHGDSGSGKSMLAKVISTSYMKSHEMPTIFINQDNIHLISDFINDVNQSCVFLFDEFEKFFRDRSEQSFLLPILDGVYKSKHIFILTCNEIYGISQYLLNRPGRIYYKWEYNGLPDSVLNEFINENLKNKKYQKDVFNILKITSNLSFDIMQSFIFECNLFQDKNPYLLAEGMNIDVGKKSLGDSYDLTCYIGNKNIEKFLPEGYYFSDLCYNFNEIMRSPDFYFGSFAQKEGMGENNIEFGYVNLIDYKISNDNIELLAEVDDMEDFIKEFKEKFPDLALSLENDLNKLDNKIKFVYEAEKQKKSFLDRIK